MRFKWIWWDAAGTLLQVRYRPGAALRSSAEAIGEFVTAEAAHDYERLVVERRYEFEQANLNRADDAFWMRLTEDWAALWDFPAEKLPDLFREGRRQLHETTKWFEPYPDTLPALKAAQAKGYRMAVLSNWDRSLHAILAGQGLTPFFEHVVASLEEGPEKPDPLLFQTLLDRCGAAKSEVIHFGDSEEDDVRGALGFGLSAGRLLRGWPATCRGAEAAGDAILLQGETLTALVDQLP